MREIYLAGGCFWGLEEVFRDVRGIIATECGYANGDPRLIPDYMLVCSGRFGYREAVKVVYDPCMLSLEDILGAFFRLIDPEQGDGQGNDIGTQYHTGVYWSDPGDADEVSRIVVAESRRHPRFFTEAGPLTSYAAAEEHHQKYLLRNPAGYCHIPRTEMEAVRRDLNGSCRRNTLP